MNPPSDRESVPPSPYKYMGDKGDRPACLLSFHKGDKRGQRGQKINLYHIESTFTLGQTGDRHHKKRSLQVTKICAQKCLCPCLCGTVRDIRKMPLNLYRMSPLGNQNE